MREFKNIGIRVIKFRLGIVLSKRGGALSKMIVPVKYGFGSPLGSGKQFMPWIAIEDLTNMFLFSIQQNNMEGVFNAVNPSHINNHDFMKILAKSMKKPFFMPAVPSFILKTILGKMSEIVLVGNKVSAKKIQESGFVFQYNDLYKWLLT